MDTTAPPSTPAANLAAHLTVEYSQNGLYTEGSQAHIEIIRYYTDSDQVPAAVEVLDMLPAPSNGTEVLSVDLQAGVYDVRSYQRPCVGSCDVMEPPSDGCAISIDVEAGALVDVSLLVRPGEACVLEADGAEVAPATRSMELTLLEHGAAQCDPPSPDVPWTRPDGLAEVLGIGFGEAVMWVLLWDDPPLGVRRQIKMVFRLTGAGPFDVVAIHDDGTELKPNWGPDHRSPDESSYGRLGEEWGMQFFFTKTGCWNLHVTHGSDTINVWLRIQDDG
ncbi:MAG: hypothetical protein IH941_12740 [Acidobacteria bacterium]|nr:hypothetical protein [Acidobacteriota bacterium]